MTRRPKKTFSKGSPQKGKPSYKGKKSFKKKKRKEEPQAGDDLLDVKVTGFTEDGEPFCLPVDHDLIGVFPRIIVTDGSDLKVNTELCVKLSEAEAGAYHAKVMRKQEHKEAPVLMGLVERRGREMRFKPFRRELHMVDFEFPLPHPSNLADGTVILAKPGRRPRHGATPVTMVKIISDTIRGQESAIAIANHEIPHVFPDDVEAETKALKANLTDAEVAEREDLRHIPIVTIDGEDAKDFDDAVWAEQTDDGFHIIVAIADVAHYIAEGGALDNEAFVRGNSTYFPDMVVPMLPERISNDLCSLRPHEDRAVLVVHMWINNEGKMTKHKFVRGVIHSAARLTYTQVQVALNGQQDDVTKPVFESTIKPVFAAYKALMKSRQKRGTLDLDIPEPYIKFDDKGRIEALCHRERMDSHKLIEEFMVLANVAAATSLQTKGAPALYRIHPSPKQGKFDRLKAVLTGYGIELNATVESLKLHHFQRLVEEAKGHHAAPILMQSLLHSQEQAKYDPQNIGHFGLNLGRYAHFTSPIRRYSDLVVHRSLIKTLNLAGKGGLKAEANKFENIGDHLNVTERRSQQAEWESRDRFVTDYFKEFEGKEYDAFVVSVQKYGLFVTIQDGMAEGLLPMRHMNDDYYMFNEKELKLTGKRNKKVIKAGTKVRVKLLEASQATGKLTFSLPEQKRGPRPKRNYKR